MMALKEEDGVITIRCEKQKDSEPFRRISLRLQRTLDSCTLECATEAIAPSGEDLTPAQRQVLLDLHRLAPSHGLTASKWEELSDTPRRTFYAARKALCDNGFIKSDREGRGGFTCRPRRGYRR